MAHIHITTEHNVNWNIKNSTFLYSTFFVAPDSISNTFVPNKHGITPKPWFSPGITYDRFEKASIIYLCNNKTKRTGMFLYDMTIFANNMSWNTMKIFGIPNESFHHARVFTLETILDENDNVINDLRDRYQGVLKFAAFIVNG